MALKDVSTISNTYTTLRSQKGGTAFTKGRYRLGHENQPHSTTKIGPLQWKHVLTKIPSDLSSSAFIYVYTFFHYTSEM
jgi:hypothetical protein